MTRPAGSRSGAAANRWRRKSGTSSRSRWRTPASYLPDNVLHSWHLDPAVTETRSGELSNDEEYALNDAGSWAHRPEAHTAIHNLFLAADYGRTYSNVDSTSMENGGRGRAPGGQRPAGVRWFRR